MSAQVMDFTSRRRARDLLIEEAHSENVRAMRKELAIAVRRAGFQIGVEPIWNRLRVQFSFDRAEDIEPRDLPEVIAYVAILKKEIDAFNRFYYSLHEAFKNGVLRGPIWTPGIKKVLKRNVGQRPDWHALKAQADQVLAAYQQRIGAQ